MKKQNYSALLAMFLGLTLFCNANAGNSNTVPSREGKSQDKAIVLILLPFEQETDPYTLVQKGDELWFLFYASKGENYIFEFTEDAGAGVLNAAFYGTSAAAELQASKKLGDKKSFLIGFTAKDQGNCYIKVSAGDATNWKGKLKYSIGKLPQS